MSGPTSSMSVGDNELPEADRYGNKADDITRTYKLVSLHRNHNVIAYERCVFDIYL